MSLVVAHHFGIVPTIRAQPPRSYRAVDQQFLNLAETNNPLAYHLDEPAIFSNRALTHDIDQMDEADGNITRVPVFWTPARRWE
jgi:hypothetical protein